MFCVWSQ